MVRLGRRTSLPPQRMTPIKIRGRRGQKARLRAQRESREDIEELDMTSSEATLAPELPFSKLESLPTEIIEFIFLYSKNLELPRASLALGRTLSSTGFKHLVLRAILVDPYLDGIIDEERFETGYLQSALLRCRWVDDAMFSHALHQARLAKLTAFFQHNSSIGDAAPHNALLGHGCPVGDASPSTIAQFVESMKSQSATLDQRRWEWVSYAGERYTLLFPDYPGRVWFRHHGDPDQVHLIYSDPICGFELRYPCEIPTKVLHGPWTKTKLKFLRSLLNASATLGWETSNNGEVAETSLREAIVQGDTSFLQLMLRQPEIAPSDSMEEIDSWPSSPAIPITQEHLRLAIFDGGCNTSIVNMLLGKDVGYGLRLDDDDNLNWDLRLDDNEILDWATAKSEEGDERGKWLLQTIGDWETDRKKGHRISDDDL